MRSAPDDSSLSQAVLVVDAGGRVVSCNTAAAQLWPDGEQDPTGTPFVSLFAFDLVSGDEDLASAQWAALLDTAVDRAVRLRLAVPGDSTGPVRVRLERALGTAGGYIATVQPWRAAPVSVGTPDLGDESGGPTGPMLLAESGPVGFFDLHLKNGRVRFSPSWKRLLGYGDTELLDSLETWHALIHPDDSAASPDKWRRKPGAGPTGVSASGSRSFSVEIRMRHRLGHWIWIQCVGLQRFDRSGELERVIGLHLDITERKELEYSLIANDARLADLSDAGPLGAFELDFAQRLFWYSPAWEELLGYDGGELAADLASFASALPADATAAGVEAWLAAHAAGTSTVTETAALRGKDGTAVPVVLGLHRTFRRTGELLRVVGFACRLPANAVPPTTSLAQILLDEALAVLGEGVVATDAEGRVLFANATAARLLHSDPGALRGQPFGEVFRLVQREDSRAGDDPIERTLSADRPLPLISDHALVPPVEGVAPVPIVWTARAAYGTDARPRGVVVVFRNPEEMTLTRDELVRANRFESLGLLAGGIAHDFNNLLTTILGAISLARDNHDPSALGDAEKACLAAKGLTRQLLSFAKGGTSTRAVCALRDIVEDSVKIASAASNARITREFPDALGNLLVDRAQMVQVFQNLIVNALQAMPHPPHLPRVHIRAANVSLPEGQVPGLPAGDYVECEVRDNGTGIPTEYLEKIFDPFFTTKKHGTGLGLATVLSIVRQHGGQIGLDSQVGTGTAFTLYLPAAEQPVEVQARRAASLRFGTGRVLFMDDEPEITAIAARMLESLDYKFDLAHSGEEAIALYQRYLNIGRPYDAVLLDLTVVGGMGGEECFRELQKLDPEVRAIVASGYDNDEMARQFLARGFCGYLTKPYRVTDLGKVLKTVLG